MLFLFSLCSAPSSVNYKTLVYLSPKGKHSSNRDVIAFVRCNLLGYPYYGLTFTYLLVTVFLTCVLSWCKMAESGLHVCTAAKLKFRRQSAERIHLIPCLHSSFTILLHLGLFFFWTRWIHRGSFVSECIHNIYCEIHQAFTKVKDQLLPFHAMFACGRSRGIAALILNLGTKWMWVVNLTPQVLYPRGTNSGPDWTGGWVGPRTGLDVLENIKIVLLPGFEPLTTPSDSGRPDMSCTFHFA